MSNIKNVIFDLGGVLINYDPKEYLKTLDFDEETADAVRKIFLTETCWKDMDLGKYVGLTSYRDLFMSRHPEYSEELRIFFESPWIPGVYAVLKENLPIYEKIRNAGYKIYVLSNFFHDGFDYLEKTFEFVGKADGAVASCREQCRKPEKEIYHRLLDRYELRPEECVFFDDNQENIDTACGLGIHGIRFTNAEDIITRYGKDLGL